MFVVTTMRALQLGVGPHWAVTETSIPAPAPGEVLVRNLASASNNADIPMLDEADPADGGHGRAAIAGYEYAGTVVAVGDDAGDWRPGDAVMGSIPNAFGEYVIADHRFVQRRPDNLAPELACALPTGLLTEHGALTRAGFTAGQSVLITGASTAIGYIGVQLAKSLGASLVIGTTRTEQKRQLLLDAGADAVIVTTEESLTDEVLRLTDGRGVDVVLDHIAGQTFAECLPATAEDGHVVNIGRLAGPAATIDLDALSYRHLTVHGVSFGYTRDWEMADVIAAVEREAAPAVARGEIRPLIAATLPFTEAARAERMLRDPATVGKVVLTFGEEPTQ